MGWKETFNAFLLKLQRHERSSPGGLSPQYDAHEQGPPEVTGGKSQGKRHRVCQRGETGSTHVCEDMERWKVQGWKKTVHPKESRGDCYIRQNKLKEKKKSAMK